jgi:hypothetical protein
LPLLFFRLSIAFGHELPSADTAAMMFWALLASGQISMRKGTVGRPSPQSPLISQLTSPPETITSCYPGTRHTEFQRHSGRQTSDSRKKPFQFARGAISRNSVTPR